MNLVFFGTGHFAAIVLRHLVDRHRIVRVVTQPPRPAGKGLRPAASAVENAARELGLVLGYDAAAEAGGEMAPDAVVVCDYGALVAEAVFCRAALGGINVHPSFLPKWRGAAPVERALLAGDAETGVCIMQMTARLDAGDVLLRSPPVALDDGHTAAALREQLAHLGGECLLAYLDAPSRHPPQPQSDAEATYAAKITVADRQLDFAEPAAAVARRVRVFAPRPGAHCLLAGERCKILRAQALPLEQPAPAGTLLEAGQRLVLACGEGALDILELQRPSRKAMPAAACLRGFALDGQIGSVVAAGG